MTNFKSAWDTQDRQDNQGTGQTGQTSQRRETGQTDLTFKLDFSGNLCRATFAIRAMFGPNLRLKIAFKKFAHKCSE